MSQNFYQEFKLGILGGGQLGRMLIQSGMDWNINFSILDPDPSAPCKSIAEFKTGKLTDYQTVIDFGQSCDLITIEIENVNVSALKELAKQGKKVFPQPEANLVEYLFSPANNSKPVAEKAESIAKKIISDLKMVGLLAVEMFVTKDQQVLVNEIAPRPHNSGHQTIEANVTSQYEQHLRSILNLPLGDTSIIRPSAMINILGEEGFSGLAKYNGLEEVLDQSGVYVHLYGKKLTKPFRKMGHVTVVDNDIESLKKKTDFVKQTLKVTT